MARMHERAGRPAAHWFPLSCASSETELLSRESGADGCMPPLTLLEGEGLGIDKN